MTMFESVESLCLSRAAGILSGLLEEWNYTSTPKNMSVRSDVFGAPWQVSIEFETFEIRVTIPEFFLSVRAPSQDCLTALFRDAFLRASTYFSEEVLELLNARSGIHPVPVIGGPSHGRVVDVDISHGSFLLNSPGPSIGGAASLASIVPPTSSLYKLEVFPCHEVPGYVLCQVEEAPSIASIQASIQASLVEIPLLRFLPTTQAFAFINTAFVGAGGNFRPLRRLPVFGC